MRAGTAADKRLADSRPREARRWWRDDLWLQLRLPHVETELRRQPAGEPDHDATMGPRQRHQAAHRRGQGGCQNLHRPCRGEQERRKISLWPERLQSGVQKGEGAAGRARYGQILGGSARPRLSEHHPSRWRKPDLAGQLHRLFQVRDRPDGLYGDAAGRRLQAIHRPRHRRGALDAGNELCERPAARIPIRNIATP